MKGHSGRTHRLDRRQWRRRTQLRRRLGSAYLFGFVLLGALSRFSILKKTTYYFYNQEKTHCTRKKKQLRDMSQ